jgi:hypothetical protein
MLKIRQGNEEVYGRRCLFSFFKIKGRIVVLEEGQESFNFLGNSFTTSISKFKITSRLPQRPMRIPVICSELNVLAAANDFFPQPLPSPSTFFSFSNLLVKESHSKHTNRETFQTSQLLSATLLWEKVPGHPSF